jgi:hypothetical protein
MHNLTEAEQLLGLPTIPVHPEAGISPLTLGLSKHEGTPLAIFRGPKLGIKFGIAYDIDAIREAGEDPNEVLLHELVHALQYFRDPQNAARIAREEIDRFGYDDAPHEVEARVMARHLKDMVRVWSDD